MPEKKTPTQAVSKNSSFVESKQPQRTQHITSWREAFIEAHAFNPQLAIARMDVRQKRSTLQQAYAEWVPSLQGKGGYNYAYSQPDNNFVKNQHEYGPSVGVNANVNLFASGATSYRIKAARDALSASEFRLQQKEAEVLTEVFQALLDLLVAQESIHFNERSVRNLKRLLENARQRFKAGLVNREHILIAEAKLADSEQDLVAARARLESANAELEHLTGKKAALSATLAWPEDFPLLATPNDEATFEAFLSHSLKKNFSVLAANFDKKSAQKNARGQRSSLLLPNLDWDASFEKRFGKTHRSVTVGGTQHENANPSTFRTGFNLKIPFPTGGEQARVREAEAGASATGWKAYETQLRLRKDLITALARLKAAAESIKHRAAEKNANNLALESMQEAYAQGERTMIDVSEVQNREARAYHDWLAARKQHFMAIISVRMLAGQLACKELGLHVSSDTHPEDGWFTVSNEQRIPDLDETRTKVKKADERRTKDVP